MNPAFSQQLLNPDLYGAKPTTKPLAMINSDEFKALLEGHFEG
jgi:hypothetical protein